MKYVYHFHAFTMSKNEAGEEVQDHISGIAKNEHQLCNEESFMQLKAGLAEQFGKGTDPDEVVVSSFSLVGMDYSDDIETDEPAEEDDAEAQAAEADA